MLNRRCLALLLTLVLSGGCALGILSLLNMPRAAATSLPTVQQVTPHLGYGVNLRRNFDRIDQLGFEWVKLYEDEFVSPADFPITATQHHVLYRVKAEGWPGSIENYVDHIGQLATELGRIRGEAHLAAGRQNQHIADAVEASKFADDVAQAIDIALQHGVFPGDLKHAVQLQRRLGPLLLQLRAVEADEEQAKQQRSAAGDQQYAPQQAVAQVGAAVRHRVGTCQANSLCLIGNHGLPMSPQRPRNRNPPQHPAAAGPRQRGPCKQRLILLFAPSSSARGARAAMECGYREAAGILLRRPPPHRLAQRS